LCGLELGHLEREVVLGAPVRGRAGDDVQLELALAAQPKDERALGRVQLGQPEPSP